MKSTIGATSVGNLIGRRALTQADGETLFERRKHMSKEQFTDAIMLLRSDHEEVKGLFGKFENASGTDRKRAIAKKICDELKIHSMIEEEIFYPAFRGKLEDYMLDEAIVEHDGAKVLINDIMAGGSDEGFYDAKVTVLREQIEHHVDE
jgi:hypothetical protein